MSTGRESDDDGFDAASRQLTYHGAMHALRRADERDGPRDSMDSWLPMWPVERCDERSMSANKGAAANRRPAGQSSASGDLSATVAADRAFPAAVAELGRWLY